MDQSWFEMWDLRKRKLDNIIRKTKRYISAKRNVQIRKTKRILKRYFISTKAYSVMMSESIYKARGFISSPQYLNLISIVDKIEIGGK